MAAIDQRNSIGFPVSNGLLPKRSSDGAADPRCVPSPIIDLTTAATFDLTDAQESGQLQFCQSLYIDASTATAAVTVTVRQTGQKIVVKAATQGYYPVCVPNPPIFDVAVSTGTVQIFALSMPMPAANWVTA